MRRQDRLATLYSHAVSRHLHGASACMHPSHQLPAAANNVTHQRTGHGQRWIKVPERRICLRIADISRFQIHGLPITAGTNPCMGLEAGQ